MIASRRKLLGWLGVAPAAVMLPNLPPTPASVHKLYLYPSAIAFIDADGEPHYWKVPKEERERYHRIWGGPRA